MSKEELELYVPKTFETKKYSLTLFLKIGIWECLLFHKVSDLSHEKRDHQTIYEKGFWILFSHFLVHFNVG